jgi:hypothetical protein
VKVKDNSEVVFCGGERGREEGEGRGKRGESSWKRDTDTKTK